MELANDMHDGSLAFFDFIYDGETWKLDGWNYDSDIKLTREEAKVIIDELDDNTYSFKEETEKDGAKHYVFEKEGTILYLNSATTSISYEYQQEEVGNQKEELVQNEESYYDTNTEDTSTNQVDSTEALINNYSKPDIPKFSGLNNKSYYSKHMLAIENYLESISATADGSGWGSFLYSYTHYTLWDDLLNEVWADLKKNLDSTSFQSLKSEQLKWISDKETRSEESRAEGGAYMWPSAFYYGTASMMTEERCIELINIYMN